MPFAHLDPGDSTGLTIVISVLLIPLFFGLYLCFKIRTTHRWPETKGTIITAQLDRRYVGTRNGQELYSYRVNILYEYNVNGLPFRCSKLSTLNLVIGDKYTSGLRVAPYKAGQSVTVYYNPSNPKDALLEKGTLGAIILWMIVDLMLCTGILVLALSH